MKNELFVALASFAICASAATFVTVTDCNGGESGTECRQITYKVRPPSPAQPQVEMYPIGDAQYGPAPKVTGGWLLDALHSLNAKANKHGLQAPNPQTEIDQYMKAGGN